MATKKRKRTPLESFLGCLASASLLAAIFWSNFFWLILMVLALAYIRVEKATDKRIEKKARLEACSHCGVPKNNASSKRKYDEAGFAYGFGTAVASGLLRHFGYYGMNGKM